MVRIKEVRIEEQCREYPFVKGAVTRLKNISPSVKVSWDWKPGQGEEGSPFQKDILCFLNYQGDFLKPCPGTTGHICCGYQILNVGTNCPMDCSYCILQSYFNQPGLRVFANIEQGLDNVMHIIDSMPGRIFRVGTGEFTDSLALDPVVGWTGLIVPRFSSRPNAILELKTKTDHIEALLNMKERNRIVISWSLNAPFISAKEEHGAPHVKKRLEAAQRCQREGFVLGFHFDPLITYPGWKEDYLRTLEWMDHYLEPKGIIWISLGSFRFMPSLKEIIKRRHPKSIILNGEFIPGKDGKMRYFKPIRVELYGFMKEQLDQWSKSLGLYLCMESDDVWEEAFGWNPRDSEGLRTYLDMRVKEIFV